MLKMCRPFLWMIVLLFFGCQDHAGLPYEAVSDYFWAQRAYPHSTVNSAFFHQEREKVVQARNNRLRGTQSDWELEGPENIGGRITDIEMVPSSFDLMWIGSASGGAFKSEDQGVTWKAMTEMEGAPPIGDIKVRPNNPDEVWIGTGETNGGSGSVAYEGFGLLRSLNGGLSWKSMGLPKSGSIGRIAMHPDNEQTLYVAAMGYLYTENEERGVYKTTNAGQTWEKVFYLDNQTGASDVHIDPNNPDVIYASMWQRRRYPDHKEYGGPSSGVYKSYDGGASWERLFVADTDKDLGRIGLAISPSNPNVLYALVTDFEGAFVGIYRTEDGGQIWTDVGQDLAFNYRTSGYWFCDLTVHPEDEDEFYICGLDAFHLFEGGKRRMTVCGMHVDQQRIFVHPTNPDLVIVGNDGGLFKSTDGLISCEHYENIPLTQFYTCALDPIDHDVLYGGTQDNNSLIRRKDKDDWENMLGGDGFVTLPHPRDNQIIYSEWQYGNIHRSEDGGYTWSRIREGLDLTRTNWNTPYLLNPHNSNVMFLGTHRVHRSDNGGDNWTPISEDLTNGPGRNLVYGTITSIDVSPIAEEVMIAGTDDGNVWITNSAGAFWEKVSEDLPERWVTRVVCDPENVDRFFVTYSGLRWHDYQAHVFVSSNVGKTWKDISNNLPEVPVNDLIVDPEDDERYWVGTDLGVFESRDEGTTWSPLGGALPISIVNDIDFNPETRTLLAATYGRSMWSIDMKANTTSEETVVESDFVVSSTRSGFNISGPKGQYRYQVSTIDGRPVEVGSLLISGVDMLNKNLAIDISGIYILMIQDSEGRTLHSAKLSI